MVTEPTGVGAEPLSSARFSLHPGQFHRRWGHRQPALPRPGALHPRLPRVSADCELHSRYGRAARLSPDSPIPVHGRGLRSPHRSLNRSCCWDTTGRPPLSEYRTSWPCTGSGPASWHASVGQRLGLQPSFDHARHVQGPDTQGVVLAHQRPGPPGQCQLPGRHRGGQLPRETVAPPETPGRQRRWLTPQP